MMMMTMMMMMMWDSMSSGVGLTLGTKENNLTMLLYVHRSEVAY